MDAVLGVDLEARVLALLVGQHLIDARRAIEPRRFAVLGQVDVDRHGRVQQLQVGRLVLGVVGVRDEDARQLVERQLAVRLGIGDRLEVLGQTGRGRVRLGVLHGPKDREAAGQVVDPHVEHRNRAAHHGAQLGQHRLGVTDDLQLLVDPRGLVGLFIGLQHVARAARDHGLIGGVGGQHAGLHGVVAALDARHVHKARRAADQGAAGEGQLGHRLESALGDGAGAVGDAGAALQMLGDGRVVLELLELVERRQEGVLIVQVHHEADGHVAVAEVVQERSAARLVVQRPAGRVLDQAGLVLLGRDLPQLLQADAELLRVRVRGQVVAGHDGLGQRAAHALGDEDILAVQFQTGLEVAGRFALAVDAEDAGDDALNAARRFVPNDVTGGHAGIDLDAQGLGLLAQPARHITQGGDVAAVVVHEGRHGEHRQRGLTLRTQHQELVRPDRGLQRRAAFLPVGEELVQGLGVDHGARQDVAPDFGGLLQNGDGDFLAILPGALLQADGGGQAGGAAADDDDVILHDLALDAGQRFQRRQLVDDGFLPRVCRAAFDRLLAHDPLNPRYRRGYLSYREVTQRRSRPIPVTE
ncbi:hypothetical protein D3C85_926300 [compost metagenome]